MIPCPSFTTVVSGLPRSGTSLMMQMLHAGGMETLSDDLRQPDTDNPRGYWEWQPVMHLPSDPGILHQATGKAVKVIHLLLHALPSDRDHRVIFMRREMSEVLASQREMLRSRDMEHSMPHPVELAAAFDKQIDHALRHINAAPKIRLLEISHADLIAQPRPQIEKILTFLGCSLDRDAMQRAIHPELYRNRAKAHPSE